MAVAAWAASTSYSLGDVRRPSATSLEGVWFEVTTAGTSGSAEPGWAVGLGGTTNDGSVVWTTISSVYKEVSVLAPNTIIELFELRLTSDLHGSNDVYRWHNGCNEDVDGNITWNGNAYTRQPIEAEGFAYSNTGTLPRPRLTVSNLDGTMTTLLLLVNETTTGNDLSGAEVRRIRTLKKFIDGEGTADPNAMWPTESWYVDRKASENRAAVVFELASKLDLPGTKVPRRQLIGNICQWTYRSAECSYTGSDYFKADDSNASTLTEDKCGKRISSCKKRFGEDGDLPFGSFPTAGRTQ